MNRETKISLSVVIGIVIFGCLLAFPGCRREVNTGQSTKEEMEITEKNHQRLVKAVAPPQLKTSQERKNLKRRLERFNVANKISYIYLVNYGKVMAFYTVKGKVSSVNSTLTTPDQIIWTRYRTAGSRSSKVVASPQLDGSYGTNGNAIFFFTTEDIYVEWSGDYMLCDEPLKLSTPPELIMDVTEE